MKVVSLFAGIGGIDLAFEQAGCEVVWANEIDKYACQTYRANFENHKNLIEGDIRAIVENNIPSHDILVAGFPCQPWSLAQSLKEKGLNDPRGNLFREIVRVLKHHKPSWFVLENVKGLLNKNHTEAFQMIIQELKDCGYQVSYQVLNAKDFGLPQNRERIFIVGNKLGIDFVFPEPTKTKTQIKDILEENVPDKYYMSDKTWQWLKQHKKKHQSKGNGFGYSAFHPEDTHTRTLSGRYQKDSSEILIFQQRKRKDPARETVEYWSNNTVPTLTSAMGMGGGHVPLIFQNRRGTMRENKENISPTLTGNMGTGGNNVPYVLLPKEQWKEQSSGLIFCGYVNKPTRTNGTKPNQEHLSRTHKQPNRIYLTEGTHPTLSATETQGRYHVMDVANTKPRKLTPRECLRLQGFPDTFKIVVSDSQMYKQVGNAVAVPVLREIAKKILTYESL